MSSLFFCPDCKGELVLGRDGFACANCGLSRKNTEYLDFLGQEGYYWGEISPERMKKVLSEAKSKGWKRAVQNLIYEEPGLEEYLLNHGRLDWLFHCLDLDNTKRALDLGSGWGSLAFDLLGYFDEVYSLEAVRERVEFQSIRKKQDKTKNLHIVRANFLKLPFKDNSFNLVVVNGVLEWVGIADYLQDPREMQINFLKEVKRILKPGGVVYVGIENRFGIHYFMGAEDHSGLPFTSIVPRFVSDFLVRHLRRTGGKYNLKVRMKKSDWPNYRTLTYGLGGYRKLFDKAGLLSASAYWTLFYSSPKFSGPFDGRSFKFFLEYISKYTNGAKESLGSTFASFGKVLPPFLLSTLAKAFSPSFLLFAYKGVKKLSFEERLIGKEVSKRDTFLKIGGSGSLLSKINYFLIKDGEVDRVFKFARFPKVSRKLEEQSELFRKFGNIKLLKSFTVGKIDVYEEKYLDAQPLDTGSSTDLRKAISWLFAFQKKTVSKRNSSMKVSGECQNLLRLLGTLPLSGKKKKVVRKSVEDFAVSLKTSFIPTTSVHGDYCSMNVLIDDKRNIIVFDWEDFQKQGNPFIDFAFFVLHSLAKENSLEELKFSNNSGFFDKVKELILMFADYYGIRYELVVNSIPYVALHYINQSLQKEGSHIGRRDFHLKSLEVWDKISQELKKLR